MNTRNAALKLANMPAPVLLLLIIGFALIVTVTITTMLAHRIDVHAGRQESSAIASAGHTKSLVYSRCYIPAGTKIDNKLLEVRAIDELDAFDDSALSTIEIAGATTKHAIPANAQIRRIDLE